MILPGVIASSDGKAVLPYQTGLVYWYDAADASTITLNSGKVSAWSDKSGNSRNMSQSSSSYQPTYTTAGRNGNNTVTFDGSNDFIYTGATITNCASSFDMWVVGNSTSAGGQAYNFFHSFGVDNGLPVGLPLVMTVSSDSTIYAGTGSGNVLMNPAGNRMAQYKAYRFSYTQSGGGGVLYQNNSSISTNSQSNGGAATGAGNLFVGAFPNLSPTYPFKGDICEVFAYNTPIGTTNAAAVQAYLTAKWNL